MSALPVAELSSFLFPSYSWRFFTFRKFACEAISFPYFDLHRNWQVRSQFEIHLPVAAHKDTRAIKGLMRLVQQLIRRRAIPDAARRAKPKPKSISQKTSDTSNRSRTFRSTLDHEPALLYTDVPQQHLLPCMRQQLKYPRLYCATAEVYGTKAGRSIFRQNCGGWLLKESHSNRHLSQR